MRLAILRILAVYLSSAALVVTQSQTEDPGPSPAASIGCVPHNDHWDCEGPRVTSSTIAATAIPGASISSHDENAPVTGSNLDPGPSPTVSIGCVPHGDHWDCEGPALASAASSSVIDSGILATATSITITASSASVRVSSSANSVAAVTSGSSTSSAPAQFTGAGSVVSLRRHFVAVMEAGVVGLGIFFAAV